MAAQLRLQIRGPNSKPIRLAMAMDATYAQLVDHVRSSFPNLDDFILHFGVPPKIQEIDGSDPTTKLTALGIRSGETIIVEMGGNGTAMVQGSGWDLPPTVDERLGRAVHYKVPGDNSCLFHSIGAALLRKNPSAQLVAEIKGVIEKEICAKPKEWTMAQLGESPASYIQELRKPNFWGGAIEIAIISAHYQVEIAVVDFAQLCVTTFAHYPEEGSDTEGYKRRVYLFYDGSQLNSAHYDLAVTTSESSRASALTGMQAGKAETDTVSSFDSSLQSIFRPADEAALNLIKKIGEVDHNALVAAGRTTKKTWTTKDAIKSKNKKPAFQGKSGALGESVNITNHMDFAPPTTTTKPTPTPTTTTTTSVPSQSQSQVKTPVAATSVAASGSTGPWNCSVCTFSNNPARNFCEMCDTPRPKGATSAAPAAAPVATPAPVQAKPTPTPAVTQPKPSATITATPAPAAKPATTTAAVAPKPAATATTSTATATAPKTPASPTNTASTATSVNRPWTCVTCTYSNRPSATNCEMCDVPRTGNGGGSTSSKPQVSAQGAPTTAKPAANPADVMSQRGSANDAKQEDWDCSQCKTKNNSQSTKCRSCGTKKQDCTIM